MIRIRDIMMPPEHNPHQLGYEEDGYGYPDGTVIFDLIDYLSIRNESKYVKITVIKNGTVVTWEGNVEVIYPS